MQYSIVGNEDGGANITVVIPGQPIQVAHSTHGNWDAIVQAVTHFDGDDAALVALFDVTVAVAEKFNKLSERVSVASGQLFFDGDRVDDALSTQVVRFLNEGVEDWKPLVNFFEKVQQNPSEHSREQLYGWLTASAFTLTPEGDIVGYKGVRKNGEGWTSILTGKAVVNGETKQGHIPQAVGDVIEMPRSEVQFDPAVGCSTGLHVGTWDYAKGFAQGAVLEVHVNPRDVVSVPTECNAAKMRTSRYTVVGEQEFEYTAPVLDWPEDDYDGWGDGEGDDDDYLSDEPDDSIADDLNDDEFDVWTQLGRPILNNGQVDVEAVANELVKLDKASEVSVPGFDGEDDEHRDVVDQIQDAKPVKPTNPRNPGHGAEQPYTAIRDELVGTGDVFESTDSRRQTKFRVEAVEDGVAQGVSQPSGFRRNIKVKRLLSRKYRRV
jgi:hypothetical protein